MITISRVDTCFSASRTFYNWGHWRWLLPQSRGASLLNLMNRALLDHYRCPETLVNLTLAGDLSPEPGYFSFGQGTVCFGRSSAGPLPRAVRNDLPDLSGHVVSVGSTLQLPFDPSQIVENLRYERYKASGYTANPTIGRIILSSRAIRKLYYRFRPLLPISVRKH